MEKNFLVARWTPLFFEWETVLSDTDFLISLSWNDLKEVEFFRGKVSNLLDEDDFYLTVEFKSTEAHIKARDLLTMQ